MKTGCPRFFFDNFKRLPINYKFMGIETGKLSKSWTIEGEWNEKKGVN